MIVRDPRSSVLSKAVAGAAGAGAWRHARPLAHADSGGAPDAPGGQKNGPSGDPAEIEKRSKNVSRETSRETSEGT